MEFSLSVSLFIVRLPCNPSLPCLWHPSISALVFYHLVFTHFHVLIPTSCSVFLPTCCNHLGLDFLSLVCHTYCCSHFFCLDRLSFPFLIVHLSILISGPKTIKKSRAWIGAQLTICAQKLRNFVCSSTPSLIFVWSWVCVFFTVLGPGLSGKS